MAISMFSQRYSRSIIGKSFDLTNSTKDTAKPQFRLKSKSVLFMIYCFFALNIAGCVVLPIPVIPDKTPFSEELKSSIQIGITTKNEVESILGTPDEIRACESVYIYRKQQTVAKLLWAVQGGTGGLDNIDRAHLVIIQFDQNNVVWYLDHVVGNNNKISNNIIVTNCGYEGKSDTGVILHAPSNLDSKAKKFLVPEGKGLIYLYRKQYSFFSFPYTDQHIIKGVITIDSFSKADCGSDGYFSWVLDEGTYNIAIHHTNIFATMPPLRVTPGKVSLKVEKGKIYFIEQTWEEEGNIFSRTYRGNFNVFGDNDHQRQEILKRNLVLCNLTRLEQK